MLDKSVIKEKSQLYRGQVFSHQPPGDTEVGPVISYCLSQSSLVRFAFQEVQYYLYTDLSPRVNPLNCLRVLELANRLVLPRLINLLEQTVIQQLKNSAEQEVFIEVLELLEPSQVPSRDSTAEIY